MPEYTVVLAGKFGVGKTSLFTRLKGERFRETAAGEGAATMARATEGLENYLYDTTVDGKDVKVCLHTCIRPSKPTLTLTYIET